MLLQGCWTDVKEGFDKDPIAYIRHVIEDTEVRPGESSRLVAAVNQIAAGKQAYRELFPNACLLGYSGSQVPGGLLEIYGQVHGSLRGIAAREGLALPPVKFRVEGKNEQELEALLNPVDRECGGQGWPCNLCRQDAGQYQPLARGLARFLRQERARLDAAAARPRRKPKTSKGSSRPRRSTAMPAGPARSCRPTPRRCCRRRSIARPTPNFSSIS